MRSLFRLSAGAAATTVICLMVLPSLLTGVILAHLRQASVAAAVWDIPPQLVPVLREAGQTAGIPWALLAGAASVATDFGRHGPDALLRGDVVGTSIFPVLVPPLLATSGGAGMFLIDPSRTAVPPPDLQDVRSSSRWLAGALATPAGAGPRGTGRLAEIAGGPLSGTEAARFWTRAIAALPLAITAIAPQDADTATPAQLGSEPNPIRRFGSRLLARLGAPATAVNLDAIAAWAAGEGSCAAFNPLDTTQPKPGATAFNTLPGGGHVWNYPSLDAGIRATAETLLNGLYQPVVAALQASAGVDVVAAVVGRSPWGTGSFGSPTFAGRRCGSPPWPDGGATAEPPGRPAPRALDGPDAIPATIVARAERYETIWDQGSGVGSPAVSDGHGLPVDYAWYLANPEWFQRPHHDYPAVDIPVPPGTPIRAVAVGRVVASDEAGGSTSCGHDVRALGGDGVLYTYCHGSRVLVSVGEPVDLGQLIMYSGWSGAVVPAGPAGAHLHFQIDVPGRPLPLCPQPALAAWAAGRTFDPHRLADTGCVSGRLP